jgi:carbon-monoxide dehydrogenase medium subunit
VRDLEILEPTSVGEAIRLLADLGDEAKIISGGTAVVLMYSQRLIAPRYLVSLAHIAGLNYIRHEPGTGLRLGALTTHHEVESSVLVRERFPILADVFHKVANIRIRNQATVGGVLAEADYASDPPAVLVGLGAQVQIQGPNGQRSLSVEDLIKGFYETTLAPDEIITEIVVPDMQPHTSGQYIKFVTRSSEDRPCVGVAAIVQLRPDNICTSLNVVVGAVSGKPQIINEAQIIAQDQMITESLAREVGRQYAEGIEPLSDMRGSSWYRKQIYAWLELVS